MRMFVRSVRHFRSACQHGRTNFSNGLKKIPNHLVSTNPKSLCCTGGVHMQRNPSCIITRALCSEVTNVSTSGSHSGGPLVEYERRIAAGELVDGDICQVGTLKEIQRLYDELIESEMACRLDRYDASEKELRCRWLWSRLKPQYTCSPVKGLYLYGGVGTGKTMLMDLFFEQLPSDWRKKRIHFHDFMLDVHSRLPKHKGVADPLEVLAAEISDEVTDVADASLLNRLFRHLFSTGSILIATSNRAPDNLYEHGLQRDLFLPFISALKERCVVHEICSSTDYRKMTSAEQGFYFDEKSPSGLLKQKFEQLISHHTAVPQEVEVVMGRRLQVPLGANGCAYFTFEELCDKPLGAADYFGLFKRFHTLALDGVPMFGLHNRAAAYRFITLVDVMYENKA